MPADVANAVSRLCPQADIQHVSSGKMAPISTPRTTFSWRRAGRSVAHSFPKTAPRSRVGSRYEWPITNSTPGCCFMIWSGSKPIRLGRWPKPSRRRRRRPRGIWWIAGLLSGRLFKTALPALPLATSDNRGLISLREGIFMRVRFPSPAPSLQINDLRKISERKRPN